MVFDSMPNWQKQPIKVVSFDLDDTLWPTARTLNRAYEAFDLWLAEQFPSLCPKKAQDWFQQRLPTVRKSPGGHCMTYVRIETLKSYFIEQGFSFSEAEVNAQAGFSAFYAYRNCVQPFQGIPALLQELKKKALMASLTNGNANVEMTVLKGHFDANFNPANVGTCKPNPDMFYSVAEHFNVSPDEILHVGDHFEEDVQAAIKAGMHALWVIHHHDIAERTPQAKEKMEAWIAGHRQKPVTPVVNCVKTLRQFLLQDVKYGEKT